MNNINGGGGRGRNMMSSVDFYRRVPKDLTEVRKLSSLVRYTVIFHVGSYGEIATIEKDFRFPPDVTMKSLRCLLPVVSKETPHGSFLINVLVYFMCHRAQLTDYLYLFVISAIDTLLPQTGVYCRQHRWVLSCPFVPCR